MAGWYGTYSVIVCYGGGYSWCCSEWAWRTLTRMSVPRTRPEPNPNPTRTRLEHDPYPIQTRPELDFSFATALMLWWFKLELASSCCCLTFTIHWRDDAYPNTNSFWRKGEENYRNNKSTQHDEALQGRKSSMGSLIEHENGSGRSSQFFSSEKPHIYINFNILEIGIKWRQTLVTTYISTLVTIKSEKKFDYFLILNESSFLQLENNPPTQNFAHFCIGTINIFANDKCVLIYSEHHSSKQLNLWRFILQLPLTFKI